MGGGYIVLGGVTCYSSVLTGNSNTHSLFHASHWYKRYYLGRLSQKVNYMHNLVSNFRFCVRGHCSMVSLPIARLRSWVHYQDLGFHTIYIFCGNNALGKPGFRSGEIAHAVSKLLGIPTPIPHHCEVSYY